MINHTLHRLILRQTPLAVIGLGVWLHPSEITVLLHFSFEALTPIFEALSSRKELSVCNLCVSFETSERLAEDADSLRRFYLRTADGKKGVIVQLWLTFYSTVVVIIS